ncbi:G patch domain-containing protein 11 [Arachis ipaensis]|uniref:G patch domain-containing protein 11 n=1 Tax=Arachis ipaensis TaxID=130454 RepID=UPI0007AF7D36|nr:G patch domain-containing protein 11 [Arachis ipaensis]
MAESTASTQSSSNNNHRTEEQDDDYMGDLSRFLPSETLPKPSSKKISGKKDPPISSSKNKLKTLSWQERRKLERERKQKEEDEQTLAKVEAPIPQSNIGFKLLKQMGYTPGAALGKEGLGRAEPVGIEIRRSRAGIGLDDPHKEKRKKEEIIAERKRRKEEDLMQDFGLRQKSRWQSKRVVANFHKAKVALDQLENREIIEPEKNEDDEEKEDEEEEEITEEDLQEVLMKLRDDHNYCLFCGCKYESKDALLTNCPGTNEDDH